MDGMNHTPRTALEAARESLSYYAPISAVDGLIEMARVGWVAHSTMVSQINAAVDAERVSASLDRENLNAQLADWRERALRCEKLRRDIVPVKP